MSGSAVDRYKKRRAKHRAPRTFFLGIILLVICILFAAWWLWSCLYHVSPEFNFLLLTKNEAPFKLMNGEGLHLLPKDRLKILKVSTNICFNRGVRLVAGRFDVNALLLEEMPISILLPDRDVFNQYEFRVEIKQFNHEIGHVDIVVEPDVEDWLERAERIIDSNRRVAFLERALTLMPKEDRIRSRLVEEYKSLKKWQKAVPILEEMAKERPDEDLLYELLEVYEAMANTDKVTSTLRKILEKNPDLPEIRLRLASTLEKTGKRKAAIQEYELLLERLKKEDRVPIYKTLGYLYTETNQLNKAISSYLKAVEQDEKDVNVFHNLSYLYEMIGQKDKGDIYLEKAVRLESGDLKSRLKLAERLIQKGKLKEAEEHLSVVLKKNPKSLEAFLLMTKIQEKRKNKKELKNSYYQILSLDPNNETVIYNLGVLEYETGNLPKSLSHFEKFLKLHPKDVEAHAFLFEIYRKQEKDRLAFEEAQTLIKLKPQEISYYHYLFKYLNNRGNYEKIEEIMKNGLKSLPESLDLKEYLVVAYLKTGKEDLATAEMEEILKKKPKDLTLLLQLAKLKEKQGELPEALQIYKKILDISPDHEEAEQAYLRVRLKVLPRGSKD